VKQRVAGNHLLSAWETLGRDLGQLPVNLFERRRKPPAWGGRPRILVCYTQTRLPQRATAHSRINAMTSENQAVTLVGMDAHSDKIALCVTRWRHGTDPEVQKDIATTLDALEATYRKSVPPGALTVLEASTNAFSIADRLEAAGFKAKVLTSDAAAGMARPDRVNDRIDARNLAAAYARGGTREVFRPSKPFSEWRDVFFGYRAAVKDSVRWSNRIWGFCSGHGLALPKAGFRRKADAVRAELAGHGWTAGETFHVEMLLKEYAHACEVRDIYRKRIERTVAENADMTRVMQVLGVRFVVAFALVAFIEDARRFPCAKKLVSYIGLNPTVRISGEADGPRRVSRYGRRDLKSLMVEAAKCAMRHGNSDMHKWARRKVAGKKHANVVACALARKLVCHVWHILMGHPAPSKEPEASFRRKLVFAARALGPEGLAKAGHAKAADYVDAVCRRLYPQTPPAELRTVSLASA